MAIIAIKEHGTAASGPVVSIDGQEYPFTLEDPFSPKEELRLGWYFEEHFSFPFTNKVKADAAAASITTYGHALFKQVFNDHRAFARYAAARQQGVETLCFEVMGEPEFHHLHWEALKDPELPQPFALQASFVRRNFQPQTVLAELRPSPTINLLVISARPRGGHDVGYRTITRPVVNALRQTKLPVQVDIVRPGSYAALEQQLEAVQDRHGTGYYHVVHFDVHGSLLPYTAFASVAESQEVGGALGALTYQARYGRADLQPYEGVKAFLFLEGPEEDQADLVEAGELARLLLQHQVPIAILNARQSGKQVGDHETSLGSQLMQAGIQTVLAMGYSVTVTAAELLMQRLYEQLFGGAELGDAVCAGRLALYNRKGRQGNYNQMVDLEDWLLPVVYQNQPQQLTTIEFAPGEEAAFYERQAATYPEPKVAYEFVGRDLDILSIERRLLGRNNLLLLRGMGGSGKTTLLHHLGYWWQTTGLVDRVFYFGYDQKAWTRQQIMDAIARQLLREVDYLRRFQPLSPAAQQRFLSAQLRAGGEAGKRHLLLLDNLESITGVRLAIQNTLDAAEQARVYDFLHSLAGGRTLVLLGSRGGEEWLADGTFGDNVYELPGLDPEAASNLADLILQRYKATKWRGDKDFTRLLKLLDGYPLPLEIVLANLQRQTPAEIVAALEDGLKEIDTSKNTKTESLLACIDYSYGNLAEDTQELLLCLAPFTGVLFMDTMAQYMEQLKAQPALAHLPFDRWQMVLQEAINWGLLAPHSEAEGYLRLQPILPYFLRNRLQALPEARTAIDTAFRQLYDEFGGAWSEQVTSSAERERQAGIDAVSLQFENLNTALEIALQQKVGFFNLYSAIFGFLYAENKHGAAMKLSDQVLAARTSYTEEELTEDVAIHFYLVFDRAGAAALNIQEYTRAESLYRSSLLYLQELKSIPELARAKSTALTYHWLGVVAQAQRQWERAEQYYEQALQIKTDIGDRRTLPTTYLKLGTLAEERGQWEQAEQYYQQALQFYGEYDDRYKQADAYYSLGMLAARQQQWEQAEQYYRQALQIYCDYDDRHAQASTYHLLGIVAQGRRQWPQAEQYFQQALTMYIDFADRYSQAGTYHQLGILATEQQQWEQAEQYFQQALQICLEFNDRFHQASVNHGLGFVALEQHQWQKASDHLLRALASAVEYQDKSNAQRIFGDLAFLWRSSGDARLPVTVAQCLGSTEEDVLQNFKQIVHSN